MNDKTFYQSNAIFGFNSDVAKKYGVDCAIFLHNIRFWILTNRQNKINFHENRTWMYNTVESFLEQFPFYSTRQIRTIIEKLTDTDEGKKEPVLLTGNYNKRKSDRTIWYAFTNESDWGIDQPLADKVKVEVKTDEKSICQNGQIHLSKLTNPFVKTDKALPYNKEDNKKDTYLPVNQTTESPNEKVGKYDGSLPSVTGRVQNDLLCSIVDTSKLRPIMEKIIGKPLEQCAHFKKWYKWVKSKQKDENQIKHGKAWVKSYLSFVESNKDYEKAQSQTNEQVEINKKNAEIQNRIKLMNQNPYNNMKK